MNLTDWIGSTGVLLLLIAFVLTLVNKISKDSITYLLMNFAGSALAAIASYLLRYIPFIILELAWMSASLLGLWKFYKAKMAGSY